MHPIQHALPCHAKNLDTVSVYAKHRIAAWDRSVRIFGTNLLSRRRHRLRKVFASLQHIHASFSSHTHYSLCLPPLFTPRRREATLLEKKFLGSLFLDGIFASNFLSNSTQPPHIMVQKNSLTEPQAPCTTGGKRKIRVTICAIIPEKAAVTTTLKAFNRLARSNQKHGNNLVSHEEVKSIH